MKTLYRASRVHTLSYPAVGEWVLVDGRHIERVGVGEAPHADRTVDLPGTTILPGFVDTHVHLTGTGVHHQAPGLGSATSAPELLDVARSVAAARQGPVFLHGWDESGWGDRTLPTLEQLDAIAERPVGLSRVDGHLVLVNRTAIMEIDLAGEAGVELDARREPTGRLTGPAARVAKRWFATHLSDHDVEELQLEAASLAVAFGVTTIHEMSMPAERGMRDLEILLAHRSRLPLDVVHYVATTNISTVMDLGLPRIGGDLPVDGSIGARTAFVSGGFVDHDASPVGYFGDDELAQYFHDGHLAGLQVGVHAIGDAAVEQVVRTWERVYQSLDTRQRRHFRARRHRIEHFEMSSLDVIERAAMLGLAISVQPTFDARWGFPGGLYEQGLGEERAGSMNRFRDLLSRGMELGAGSDSPITTIDPLVGVAAFEGHHDPTQRLGREEAVRVFTLGSARLAHQEDKKGSLEPGKHADFAVYDVDPLVASSLEGVRPVLTVSLGRDVYAV
ncbi:MAG TPA: amidohydrolase family protein [Actinomycetota bacterium]|nr:amidohydrolase family protein [Actinomycetota bacterium]